MPVERSAGAVIFRNTPQGREYLLLQHQPQEKISRIPKVASGHWDFPKGHIEGGEKTEAAVRREVAEETGLSGLEIVPGFKETVGYFVKYSDGAEVLKFVAFFLAQAKRGRVKLSWEHQAHKWLSYEEAYRQLAYSTSKKVLQAAERFLSKSS